MADLPTKQQFITAYNAAPASVREAMTNAETTNAITRLGATYNLHVDITGKIAGQVGYMLLGLLDPGSFYQNLLSFGLTNEAATAVVKDINTQIFQPLQKRIREGVAATSEEDEEEAEYSPELAAAMTASAPSAQPQQPQVPVMEVQATPALAPTPVQPQPTVPAPVPEYNLIRPDVAAPEAVEVQVRTMQSDMELMRQDPTGSTIHAATAYMPHPSQVTPARAFQTASVPFTSVPAQPRSIEPTPAVSMSSAPAPFPAQEPSIQPQPIPKPPASGEYTTDPYREAV